MHESDAVIRDIRARLSTRRSRAYFRILATLRTIRSAVKL